MRTYSFSVMFMAVILVSLVSGRTRTVSAQTETKATSLPLFFGEVKTETGEQATNVRVWLVGGKYDAPVILGETTTDQEGKFAFTDLPSEVTTFASSAVLTLWSQSDEGQLGWTSDLRSYKRKSLSLRLKSTTRFEGRLLSDQGEAIQNAIVLPVAFGDGKFGSNNSNRGQLSPDMTEQRRATTDQNGNFTLGAPPASGSITFIVKSETFGSPHITCNLGSPVIVKLSPATKALGKVTWPAGLSFPTLSDDEEFGTLTASSFQVRNAEGNAISKIQDAACFINQIISTTLDENGHFELESVTPGTFRVNLAFSPKVPLQARSATFVIQSDKPNDALSIAVERGFRVSGRVVGLLDKKPIPDATVQFWHIKEGSMRYSQNVTTDETGRYVTHLGKGTHLSHVIKAPENYVLLDANVGESAETKERIPRIDITADTPWPDLQLDPAGDIELHIVNEQGEPVPDAIVKIVSPAGYPVQKKYGTYQRADSKGHFLVRRVALNDTLPIRVRTKDAISKAGLVITPGEVQGPLSVILSPDNGFRIRGQIVTPEGVPVPNAVLKVSTSFPYVSKWLDSGMSISGSAGSFQADANGVVVTGPLWPDFGYRVSATMEGYDRAESPYLSGKIGETLELKPLVISPALPPIAGTVIDSDGQPLSGVRVFSAGKKWQMAESVTDESGRYRLEDVAPDVLYVFADSPEHRFGGSSVIRGQDSTIIVLRAKDSPPQKILKIRSPKRDSQLEIVKQLVEQTWELPTGLRSTARLGPLQAMVQVNPDSAFEMSNSIGGHFNDVVLCELAGLVVQEDPDHALELLQKTGSWRGYVAALKLSKELAASKEKQDRELAMQFANLAERKARAESDSIKLARLIPLFRELGQSEKANELSEQMLQALDPKQKSYKYLLSKVAVGIAPTDFAKAQQLVLSLEEGHRRTKAQAEIAVALVATDIDKAILEVETLSGDINTFSIRARARLEIALKIVNQDLDRAVQLVQAIQKPDYRAQALGYLAVAVAEIDQERAWKLIDEALLVHRGSTNEYSTWVNYGSGGPFAAALAYQANLTGYPDMESVIWHVRFACRAKSDFFSRQSRLKSTIGTARILALVDQLAACDLLGSIENQQDQIARGAGGLSLYDQWLQAWILVDFRRGANMLKEDLDELAASGKEAPLRYGHGDVFRLIAAPRKNQFEVIISNETGLWQLNDD